MGLNGLLLGQSVVQSGRLRGNRLRKEDEAEQRRLEAEEQRAVAADAWRMALQQRQEEFRQQQLRQQAELAAQNRIHQSSLQMQRIGQQGAEGEANRASRKEIAMLPARRGSGTGPPKLASDNSRLLRSAARTMGMALDRMDAAARDDPNADVDPITASAAEGVGNLPVVGHVLRGLTRPLEQGARSSAQNRYHTAQTILSHTYPSLLRHARNGPQMVQMMGEALGQMSETADPVSRAEKRRFVREIFNDYWREIFQEEPPEPGTLLDESEGPTIRRARLMGGRTQRTEDRESRAVPGRFLDPEPEASASPDGSYTNRRSRRP